MNKADVEFYESAMVMRVARTLAAGRDWDALSHRSRRRYLDRAIDIVHDLINDHRVRARFRALGM